jgi:heat-inducible transcriptional repressor
MPSNHELSERERDILKSVIQHYIASGKPVGSRILSKERGKSISPATIRNIMADLEESGYLIQPHTSAGRVPTDKGYRFYVDNLLESSCLDSSDQELIDGKIFTPDSHDNVMERISQAISHATNNVGFVISPSLGHSLLKHIEFIQLGDSKILVIIVSKSGLVQNRVIRIDEPFTQSELDQTAKLLNEHYSSYSLLSIRDEILRKMKEEKALYDRLHNNVILLCDRGLIDEVAEPDVDIYLDGASNFLGQPEFADTMRMRSIFKTFEEKSRLVKILNECIQAKPGEGVRIIIGSENALPGMREYTLISSPLMIQDQNLGSVGILGPTRMEYAKAITIVDYVAKLYGQILSADSGSSAVVRI